MKNILYVLMLSCPIVLSAQNASIKGQLADADGEAILFANVLLFSQSDSVMIKAVSSDDVGIFSFNNLSEGKYYLQASYVGLDELNVSDIGLKTNEAVDLGALTMQTSAVQLEGATVTAKRSILEVKADRTVFNVEGTINSTGSDGINLLRKAPGVLIDNNNNIQVLGRSGVLVYVDGKRLPLSGVELSSYLENLQAEQIDKIDIITNPGAKYEAEGNAGIIDIILKKDKSHGFNGNVNGSYSIGIYPKYGGGVSGNFRNSKFNVFGSVSGTVGQRFNTMDFTNQQNGIYQVETNDSVNDFDNANTRVGLDYFLNDKNTIGFLVNIGSDNRIGDSFNKIQLSPLNDRENIDSTLIAETISSTNNRFQTYNLNYAYAAGKDRTLNIDFDYGQYINDVFQDQSNLYYDAQENNVLTAIYNDFDTPTEISISSAKLDYEQNAFGGRLGLGTKLSQVLSDNTFLFYDLPGDTSQILNTRNSNNFNYDEKVYAGYVNYARTLSPKLDLNAGLRAEFSDIFGDLMPFEEELQEDPVDLEYLSWFPNVGLSYKLSPVQTLNLSYGRRINRPDYNVLNPFNYQMSQLSYMKGNPFLRPEIVNNVELGYTLFYRFNFKLAYSKTADQITRLIAPDDEDPRAGFITWANLASQTVYSFNASLPFQFKPWWSAYFNFNSSYIDNQADYGDGAIVDVQAFSYTIYQQQSFTLGKDITAEVSGWYSGPGVWGGVFLYDPSFSLDFGLQKKFFNKRLNVRLSVSDVFYQTGWTGMSNYAGLISEGAGNYDSRRFAINVNYSFGNDQVKSRKRKTGIEEESKRVK